MDNIEKHKQKKGFVDGFTVVETMLALSLLGMGIMAMTTMQIASTNSTTTTEILTQNAFHGFDQFEKLIAADYKSVASDSFTDGIYTVTWEVSPPSVVTIPNTKAITITMFANRGGLNDKGRMSFVYYKADPFADRL